VLGRRMEDWLRPSVAYWHSFVANGLDPFGAPTQDRPWFSRRAVAGGTAEGGCGLRVMERLGLPFSASTTVTSRPRATARVRATAMLDQVLERSRATCSAREIRLLWAPPICSVGS